MRNIKTIRRLLAISLWVAFACFPFHVFSQEVPEIAKKLENVFEEKEPKWKIERPYRQTSPPVMHLTSVEGDILIYFWLTESEVNAKDIFDGNLIAFSNTLGKRKKETKLSNIGDDNMLLSDLSGRFANFFFRKGKTYISILAPTDVIAKKFGYYVMDEIRTDELKK